MRRTSNQPLVFPRTFLTLLVPAVVLLVLTAGCSSSPGKAIDGEPRPLGAGIPDAHYALSVELSPQDSLKSVEAKYDGHVLVWEAGSFAILGVDVKQNHDGLEENDNAFLSGGERAHMNGTSSVWAGGSSSVWAGGSSAVWAGGTSSVWAGGSSSVWAGGAFTWLPENTATWRQIRLEEGQALAPNLGNGVKVAVIDTGLDLDHPALKESLAPANQWWDFYGDDNFPQDEGILGKGGYGHGTNVAGIIRQIAPRATILPIRVLGPDGSGNLTDLASAIDWAAQMGADVINLSLGSDKEVKAVESVIDAVARKGVIVVASTGNTGDTNITFPARLARRADSSSQRISMTSVDHSDVKSTFATYGADVELAAPGEKVLGPAPEHRLASWSGTSMAAPMASGALALALGEDLVVPRANLTEELKASAYALDAVSGNRAYIEKLGDGRLDVAAFLGHVTGKIEPSPPDDGGGKDGDDGDDDDEDHDGDDGAPGPAASVCKGGVTQLTLRYTGRYEAYIRVRQEKGPVVFAGRLQPQQTFSFQGRNRDGTLGKEIKIYVNRDKQAKAKTDCSEPIGPGVREGWFEIVSGESKDGGVLSRPEARP